MNIDELKTRVPGKGQDMGQPSLPSGSRGSPFEAPYQVPVLDPGTGVPIIGRPKLDRYPIGPINLDLPSDKPALRMDQLFRRVFSGGNLDVSKPEMQLALSCWMATSKDLSILRTQIQQLGAVINNMQQAMADLQAETADMRLERFKFRQELRHQGLYESSQEDTEWQQAEDGRYVRFLEDVHLVAIRVGVLRHPSGELVVFDYAQLENVDGADPGWIGQWDGMPMSMADVDGADDGPYDGLEEVQTALETIAKHFSDAGDDDEQVEAEGESPSTDDPDDANHADD